ncbi:MAG: S-layer homology domain-containing protein [Peptococcaceae bacterium]|nr:S-layer homology domain-containing protein [Peptococcaceae bacterium]
MNTIKFRIRKVLALLLALAMLFSMMPTSWAYAADSKLTVKLNNQSITGNKITLQNGGTESLNIYAGDELLQYEKLDITFKDKGKGYYGDTSDILQVTEGSSESANANITGLKLGETSIKVSYIDDGGKQWSVTFTVVVEELTVKFNNQKITDNKMTLQLGTTKMINVNVGMYSRLYSELSFSFQDQEQSSFTETSSIVNISAIKPGGMEDSANPGLTSVYVKSLKPGTTTVQVEYTDSYDQQWTASFDVEVVETGEITGISVRPYLDDSQNSQPQDKIYYVKNNTAFYIDPIDNEGKTWSNHLYFSNVNWSLSDGSSLPESYMQNIFNSTAITFKSPPEGINETLVAMIPNLKLQEGDTEYASTSFTVKTKAPEYTCTLRLYAETNVSSVTIDEIKSQLDSLQINYSSSGNYVEISGANLSFEAELNELYSKYGSSQDSNWDMNEFLGFINEHFFNIDVSDDYIIKPQHLHDYEKSYFNMSGDDGFFILTLDMLPGIDVDPVDDSQQITVTLVNRNGDGETETKTFNKGEWINPIYDFPSDSSDYPVTSWSIEGESSAIQGPVVLTKDITLNAQNNVPPHYARIVVLEDDQETDLIHKDNIIEYKGQKYTPKIIGDPQELNGEDRDYTYKVSLTEYETLYDGSYSDSEEERAALYDFMKNQGLIQKDETDFYKTSVTQYKNTYAGQSISVENDDAIPENTTLTIATFVVSFWPQPMEITPADVTIYTGGDGYEGAINSNGASLGTTNGFPEPGFTIDAPDGVSDFDPANAKLKYDDGTTERTWNIVPYDGVEDAEHNIYRFVPATETDKTPVRMQFILSDETVVTDDTVNFDELLYEELTMEVYGQGIDAHEVTLEYDGLSYLIDADTGTLTVRGTSENTETPLVNASIEEGKAGVEAPADTTYYINNKEVTVSDPSGIALLFDDIIENNDLNGISNTDMLIEKADETIENLGHNTNLSGSGTRYYECKYLDLVDTNNGNVWVAAEDGVTVSWPLPEGTNKNTKFELIHFPGLHREMGVDAVAQDIEECDTEQVEITNTGTHIEFHVDRADFSPFVLVWEKSSGGGTTTTPDLNTEDHFSYIVGYPEDYRTGEPTDDENLWPVKPQGNITRAEVATIFYRLLTDEARTENWTQDNSFTDVDKDDWFNTPVSTLSAMGIIRGYEDGSFQPNAPITRAEFAAIAVRFFEEDSSIYEEGTFNDVVGGEWFANAVQAAKEHGIIGGYPDGSFQPNKSITRAEACSIVNRTLGRIPDEEHLLPVEEMNNWPDNLEGAWYYADMQEATNGHEYEWITDDGKTVEDWTGELPEIDWDEVERELCEAHGVPYNG